jgi:hypothetical protein
VVLDGDVPTTSRGPSMAMSSRGARFTLVSVRKSRLSHCAPVHSRRSIRGELVETIDARKRSSAANTCPNS